MKLCIDLYRIALFCDTESFKIGNFLYSFFGKNFVLIPYKFLFYPFSAYILYAIYSNPVTSLPNSKLKYLIQAQTIWLLFNEAEFTTFELFFMFFIQFITNFLVFRKFGSQEFSLKGFFYLWSRVIIFNIVLKFIEKEKFLVVLLETGFYSLILIYVIAAFYYSFDYICKLALLRKTNSKKVYISGLLMVDLKFLGILAHLCIVFGVLHKIVLGYFGEFLAIELVFLFGYAFIVCMPYYFCFIDNLHLFPSHFLALFVEFVMIKYISSKFQIPWILKYTN